MTNNKSKKIGILNYHNGINYGAYLQCYALFMVISNKGYDVEIINYKNFRHWYLEYKYFLFKRNPVTIVRNIIKIIKFKKCLKRLKLSSFTWSNRSLKNRRYDYIIVGSDEVWNFTNPLVGFDLTYFGKGFLNSKMGSYAASFGWLDGNSVLPHDIVQGLKEFKFVSVRDYNSKQIVNKNLNVDPYMLLDPTMLYDFKLDKLSENILDNINDKYLLVYSPGFDKEYYEQVVAIAKLQGLKIVSVGIYYPWADINLITADPFEWLVLFKSASYIITSSFHGTVFSIKYHKQFISSPNKASYNKIYSLLKEFNLIGRMLYGEVCMDDLDQDMIDYQMIEMLLKDRKSSSMNYLLDFLESE